MAATLGGELARVLDGWELLGRHAAVAGQPAGEQRGRRGAREGAEVPVEVRLVVVAAVDGHLGQRRAPPECPEGALEAQEAGERLRVQADLLAKARTEVTAAPPHFFGELGDRHGPSGGREPMPRM